MGIAGTILYLLIVPESPAWYFLKDGPTSARGIKALNYIAWFNGSPNRVPDNAVFDLIGQAVAENASVLGAVAGNASVVHQTSLVNTRARLHMSVTLNNSIMAANNSKGGSAACKEIR